MKDYRSYRSIPDPDSRRSWIDVVLGTFELDVHLRNLSRNCDSLQRDLDVSSPHRFGVALWQADSKIDVTLQHSSARLTAAEQTDALPPEFRPPPRQVEVIVAQVTADEVAHRDAVPDEARYPDVYRHNVAIEFEGHQPFTEEDMIALAKAYTFGDITYEAAFSEQQRRSHDHLRMSGAQGSSVAN